LPTDQQAALAAALDRLWLQFLPVMRERVAVLEAAAQDFAADTLPMKRHEEASASAHKLAGSCGTFGLTRATVLARELELMYSQDNGPNREASHTLIATTAELRSLIEARK
jgi:HPt (histidine-containing phosphotransfer) domain-containing protein